MVVLSIRARKEGQCVKIAFSSASSSFSRSWLPPPGILCTSFAAAAISTFACGTNLAAITADDDDKDENAAGVRTTYCQRLPTSILVE